MFDGLFSIIAPHLCYSCGKTGAVLCDNCKYDINSESFSGCIMCGQTAGPTGICASCPAIYSRAWCVGERSGALREVIDSYKFYNNYAAHRDLADLLSVRIGRLPENCILVPVPTVSSHIRQRGYDHAFLITKRIGKLQSRPVRQLLVRKSATTQRGENRAKRLSQASEAFGAKKAINPNVTYLIVDDVTTTGATLHFAAKTLLDGGAKDVWVGVIARQPLD